jgi:DnaJ-class molecular chaperone
MFQKCPVCEGSGFEFKVINHSKGSVICSTCNGKKMIHVESGKPPVCDVREAKLFGEGIQLLHS